MRLATGFSKSLARRRESKTLRNRAVDMALAPLERRRMFAVSAFFAGGSLTVIGDSNANTITVSRDPAGKLLVNGGAVTVKGGTATVTNTSVILALGFNGDDRITLDESNGALPKANLFGGVGNDTLTGGSGADQIFGQSGNDQLLGKGGLDRLFGGGGNDVLTGGTGDDQAFGQSGNDRMIWNPGEGTDLNEGGAGVDTVEVNGGNGDENFTATANGTRVRFDRVSPAPFSLDIGTSENLVLNANGGNDTFTGGNGLAPLISLTVDGGAGNDTVTGGDGNDTLLGGDGNDLVVGGRGNDIAFLGDGDDIFVWNPGDASDVVEGQSGTDTLQFNGANVNESMDLSANGSRLRLFRDVGAITMDVNDTEFVNINALGGADKVTVNDLSGTDVTNVFVDLAAGGGAVDSQADNVIINGTAGDDVISLFGDASLAQVVGLAAQVQVKTFDTGDRITVNALAGDDVIDAGALSIGSVQNGGDGDDILIGGDGADTLNGEAGDDVLIGGDGLDILNGGTGDNVVIQ